MPATNNQLVSMAQQFTGLPMGDLIGGPLMAAAEANNQMAMTQVRFMLETCFQKDTGTEKYNPIMVEMELIRGVIVPPASPGDHVDLQETKSVIKVPLLTLLPLNSLAVDNVDINFEMEVKSSFGETATESEQESLQAQSSFEAKIGYGPFSATITGSVSYSKNSESSYESHYEKSNSARYSVNVHAGQLPLPGGVKTIIDAYAQNITPITVEAA